MLNRKGAALDDVDLSVSFETMRMPELSSKACTWCSLVSVMELGCLIKDRGIIDVLARRACKFEWR